MKQSDIDTFTVDRAGWGSGPWDDEPDRVDFHHVGLPCLLLRSRNGNWCGYVGLPKGHPDFGASYNDVEVEVHGGLTYGEKCDGSRICHVPEPGESDDRWWLGFDCHHCWDIAPGFEVRLKSTGTDVRDPESQYRDVRYVRNQTEHLAEQLARRIPADPLPHKDEA